MAQVWNGKQWVDSLSGVPISPQPNIQGTKLGQVNVPTPAGYTPPPSEYQVVTGPDGQPQLVSTVTGQPWSTAPTGPNSQPTVASVLESARLDRQKATQLGLATIDKEVNPYQTNYDNTIAGANALDANALLGIGGALQGTIDQRGQILGQVQQDAAGANQASYANLSGLGNIYGQANAADLAGYGQLAQTYAPLMNQLQSRGYVGDVTSQAAQAYANPQDIQNQQGALNQFQNWMGGSANLQSQAAGAYADPQAIAAQKAGMGLAGNIATGGLNVAADPESLAAQQDVLARYKAGSDPTVTAQEHYIMELARQRGEQQERSSREAVLSDLRSRGMSGSGAELGSMLGAQQNIGQQRVLSDLGMQANAVARAERMLEGYGNTANTMRGQADSLNTGNADRQLQGTGLYIDAAGNIREQSFNEAFNRGSAADAMGNANRDFSLMAGTQAGNLATDMRNAGFDESYKRGTAADDTAMFNKENLRLTNQWQDQYAQDEASRVAKAGLDLNQAGRDTTLQIGNRGQNLYDSGADAINAAYDRQKDVTGARWNTTNLNYDNTTDFWNDVMGVGQTQVGRAGTQLDFGLDKARIQTGLITGGADAEVELQKDRAGEIAAEEAAKALKDKENEWNWNDPGASIFNWIGGGGSGPSF